MHAAWQPPTVTQPELRRAGRLADDRRRHGSRRALDLALEAVETSWYSSASSV